jgi:hypothetical protein
MSLVGAMLFPTLSGISANMSLYGPLSSNEIFWVRRLIDVPYSPDDDEVELRIIDENGPLPESEDGIETLIEKIRREKRSNDSRIFFMKRRNRELSQQMAFLRDHYRDIAEDEMEKVTDPSTYEDRRKSEIDNG